MKRLRLLGVLKFKSFGEHKQNVNTTFHPYAERMMVTIWLKELS